MFLKTKVVNTLIKEAFRSGLVIASTEGIIHLEGRYWMIDIDKWFLPKEIKAKLIELVGYIPEVGERIVANKDGWQQEIGELQIVKENFDKQLEVTSVMIKSAWEVNQRILQDENGRTYLINDVFVNMTTGAQLEDGEDFLDGPCCNSRGVIWRNNAGALYAPFRQDQKHERILEEMTKIDLTEDVG